jgi:type VI secretion system secreted protein Hcp
MATMNFMKVDGADGDAQDKGHKDWIDILPFDIGASNQGSFGVGSGCNVGGADHHDLHISAILDKAMPVIFYKCASGDTVPTVTFHACKMANKVQVPFQTITLTNVLFTSINTGSGSSGEGLQLVDYGITYEQMKIEYTPISADGAKGATVSAGWNAATNKKL